MRHEKQFRFIKDDKVISISAAHFFGACSLIYDDYPMLREKTPTEIDLIETKRNNYEKQD